MRRWMVLLALLAIGCDDGGDSEPVVDAGPGADSAGAGGGGGEDSGAPLPPPAAFSTICSSCHGPNGEGSVLAYELRHPTVPYATFVVRNGRLTSREFAVTMSAYDDSFVSDEDLEAIWAWLGSFPQPTSGEALYLDYCGNCHGPDGTGGGVEESARQDAETIRTNIRAGAGDDNYGDRATYMPAFGTDRLSDAEIELIVEFLTD